MNWRKHQHAPATRRHSFRRFSCHASIRQTRSPCEQSPLLIHRCLSPASVSLTPALRRALLSAVLFSAAGATAAADISQIANTSAASAEQHEAASAGLLLPLPTAQSETTITYPADYFQQWDPVTVADMIDRIPGTAIALDGNSGDTNTRGLGSAESILINGRRMSGMNNNVLDQLRRIAYNQVSHIEIIRGTSSDLVGVRNAGQIINIVTTAERGSSLTVEASADHYQDSHLIPGGSLTLAGTRNALEYRFSAESRPEYQTIVSRERSLTGSFVDNDRRRVTRITDQTNQVLNSNLSYEFRPGNNLSLNLMAEQSDPPQSIERAIFDLSSDPPALSHEHERVASRRRGWEVGVDYNYRFADNSRLQMLTINNYRDHDTTRERFRSTSADPRLQDLRLRNDTVDKEQISRGVYTRPLHRDHTVELGMERARTVLETELELFQLRPAPVPTEPPQLTAVSVPNADSQIEEVRYESFVVHHWDLNPKMKIESTLLYERSTISQSGDTERSRSFDFIRPKVDYRYNMTPTLQLRVSAEKYIAQLHFADFAAAPESRDDEQDTVAGNPELKQEQSWRYNINLEYRFLEDRGVINARAFYWDISDVIGRIDISAPNGPVLSANGNIGRGEVKGLQLNSSFRVTPDILISGNVLVRSSEVSDPFSGQPRRIPPNDRGNYRLGIRHDMPQWNLNYGLDHLAAFQGNRPIYDINRIDDIEQREELSVFVEKTAISRHNLTARLDARNLLNNTMCTDRLRFDGHLANGIIREIEKNCNQRGPRFTVLLRGTF